MAKKQFKAESKRLLDLMINSIYTHKEIFLREIISNASDAIDKLYYKILSEDVTGVSRDDFEIFIDIDKENKTLKIRDNGIGMNEEELEKDLGTIAKSGSLVFKDETEADMKNLEGSGDIDIIGQFGVGFYSAFMVSDKITVVSRAFGEKTANKWESNGADGYKVSECTGEDAALVEAIGNHGTEIILNIKADTEDEKYSEYLELYKIKELIKKYSDYIRYPIRMMVEKQSTVDESETYKEPETLNSMVPIWKKQKNQITDEEYNEFYKNKFYDFTDPLKVIHTSVEGVSSYDALLFIPAAAPYDYYTKEFEKGLQLYSSGVMIMNKCADLLPDYFSFVKGLVDSQDLSLNISREMLQHGRQVRAIASRLEKKIKSELLNMLENDRANYEKFFNAFRLQLKFGVYDEFGVNKDKLIDLLMYYSSSEKKMTTLAEYVKRAGEDQKYIYYAVGESIEKIDKMPQTEILKDRNYEILYMTDSIDEFALQVMLEFEGKKFKSVSADDLEIEESQEEKDTSKKQTEEYEELLAYIKECLKDKVTDVKLSHRLKSHPVCLTTKGPVSLEMEKVLNQMPSDQDIKAERILEINASHKVLPAVAETFKTDKERVKMYADILYNQALLIEGLPVEDPVAFGNAICELIV